DAERLDALEQELAKLRASAKREDARAAKDDARAAEEDSLAAKEDVRDRKEDARHLLMNAEAWAIHYSNIRLLVTTFLLGACWTVLSTEWEQHSDTLYVSIYVVCAFTLALFIGFTSAQQKKIEAERKSLAVLMGDADKMGPPPEFWNFQNNLKWWGTHLPSIAVFMGIAGVVIMNAIWHMQQTTVTIYLKDHEVTSTLEKAEGGQAAYTVRLRAADLKELIPTNEAPGKAPGDGSDRLLLDLSSLGPRGPGHGEGQGPK
ncbi:MAG TPA: hypothetical protein VFB30_19525, partial [Spirochaetia bacterium]|nr:hypothetical protein [Spirochaetia bacterium]